MQELLADRFMPSGCAWIDLASGESMRVRLFAEPRGSARFAWNDWCAAVAAMRHPAMHDLVDYGVAGATRSFEAYRIRPPLATTRGAGAGLLAHAAAFLESRGVPLDADRADALMRHVIGGVTPAHGRSIGLVLQPRAAARHVDEALSEATPGGMLQLVVAAERGAGLRTFRMLVARHARLHGYVPLSARLVAEAPWLARMADSRHVCLLVGPGATRAEIQAAAQLFGTIGLRSTRRHVLIRFTREASQAAAAISIDRMGVTAMVSMIFRHPERQFDSSELFDAAHRADGLPGLYLMHLRARYLSEQGSPASIAHESPAIYTVEPPPAPRGRAAAGRSLASACSRAARLAARGRHAAAVRLLIRASRVLELRGDRSPAAACAEQLGWLLRDRGRTRQAIAQFERVRTLARDREVWAAIGIAIAWTDEGRFTEAEATLRGAAAAAGLVGLPEASYRAALALARCLLWAERRDEALAALPAAAPPSASAAAECEALRARILLAQGRLSAAAAAAGAASERAADGTARDRIRAARVMAETAAAMGDRHSARVHAVDGLRAAGAAHLPLLALRLRALLAGARARDDSARQRTAARVGAASGHASIPPLVRLAIERAVAPLPPDEPSSSSPADAPAIALVQELLERAFAADDDEQGMSAVLQVLMERLRAATIEVVAGDAARRVLGSAGRPWSGGRQVGERALTGGAPRVSGTPAECAHAITQAGRPIAALACRWTAGACVGPDAAALLRAGALALAPAVRALLDRVPVVPAEGTWRELIGESAPAVLLRDSVARAARAPFPVLIEGESGSGKELVARAIHRLGPRRDRRLCAVNCAALSEDLLEAELFGHVRGAFTGAVSERAGLFEEADGGSIFLDEVGELSPRAQAKLLRVLQDGEVRRVGENFARRVDARVIAATNRRLETEVEAGRFRTDLRFRLDVVRIVVPPLRERADDIPLLAAQFWDDAARRVNSRAVLGADTVSALARYDWPGNVRQLQNVIASLAVHAPRRGRVPPSMLPAQIARTSRQEEARTFEEAREAFERRFVAAELARAGGHRARAARALGVTRQGLAKMLRRLGLDDPRGGARTP